MDSILKSGGSIKEQRPSKIKSERDGHSTSEVQEDLINFKPGTPTVDGGNSSDLKVLTS